MSSCSAQLSGILVPLLIVGNLLCNVVASSCFKLSALSQEWRRFLLWQIAGNLAGFIAVLTLTGLLRFVPLHIAHPITTGLAVIGVQVIASHWLFGEAISPTQWLGVLLIAAGILLIGGR